MQLYSHKVVLTTSPFLLPFPYHILLTCHIPSHTPRLSHPSPLSHIHSHTPRLSHRLTYSSPVTSPHILLTCHIPHLPLTSPHILLPSPPSHIPHILPHLPLTSPHLSHPLYLTSHCILTSTQCISHICTGRTKSNRAIGCHMTEIVIIGCHMTEVLIMDCQVYSKV